jgi:hypothetical protein
MTSVKISQQPIIFEIIHCDRPCSHRDFQPLNNVSQESAEPDESQWEEESLYLYRQPMDSPTEILERENATVANHPGRNGLNSALRRDATQYSYHCY